MVTIGFPSGAPEQVNNSLQMIQGRVEQLKDIGKKARDALTAKSTGKSRKRSPAAVTGKGPKRSPAAATPCGG